MNKYTWIKAFFSPFKRPKLYWYFGKTVIGVPYFLPRKWVKMNEQDCRETLKRDLERAEKGGYKLNNRDWTYYKNHKKAVDLKFGFSSCGLGWKTKWSNTDYRHEWNPVLSFVCFGYQIALQIIPDNPYYYWTSWLYYEKNTDRTKSRKERIEQCKTEFPQTWRVSELGKGQYTVDYYNLILKKKYL